MEVYCKGQSPCWLQSGGMYCGVAFKVTLKALIERNKQWLGEETQFHDARIIRRKSMNSVASEK